MKYYFFLIAAITCISLDAQVGGTRSYNFLNLTNSARVAALGGKNVSLYDADLNMVYHNPALLSPGMEKNLVLNYVNYFAGINYGYVSYAGNIKGMGTMAGGIHYVNYGSFVEANELGIITGEFTASEYAANISYSRPIDSNFIIGVNIKPIYSHLEKYNSFGLGVDIGSSYLSNDKLFSAGLVVRNVGFQLKGYTRGNPEPLPLEIQAGMTKRLEHAPFRFSITAHQLQKPVLTYKKNEEEETENLAPEKNTPGKTEDLLENTMRHLIFGVEFIPFESFHFRVGYNYQRRKEMQITSRVGGVGFSWGFGVFFNRFSINYGRATYHLAGASNHFSLVANLDEFYSKK